MQTFLPYADFTRSAAVLDVPRLGKQRVETLQILRALELFDYGWGTHPAVQMWRGHTPALVCYGLTFVAEWTRGGRAETTAEKIAEFAPEVGGRSQEGLIADGLMPPWWGDERLHSSHRSALVRKDPDFYRPVFGDDDGDVPYFWPDPPSAPSTLRTGDGSVWVVRPSSPEQFAEFRRGGHVGFGTESGIAVDGRFVGRGPAHTAQRGRIRTQTDQGPACARLLRLRPGCRRSGGRSGAGGGPPRTRIDHQSPPPMMGPFGERSPRSGPPERPIIGRRGTSEVGSSRTPRSVLPARPHEPRALHSVRGGPHALSEAAFRHRPRTP